MISLYLLVFPVCLLSFALTKADENNNSTYVIQVTTRGYFIGGWPIVTLTGEKWGNLTVGPIPYTLRNYERSASSGNIHVHSLEPQIVHSPDLGRIEQVTVTLLENDTKSYHYWFLDTVIVNQTSSGIVFEYVCWCWLWRDQPKRRAQVMTLARTYNFTEEAQERRNPKYSEL